MIFGHINAIDEIEGIYPAAIVKTLRYLAEHDLTTMEVDVRHNIDGDNIFFNIVDRTTKAPIDCKPETHRKCLDVHFLLSGQEQIGVTINNGSYEVAEDMYPAKDATFYVPTLYDECLVRMKAGHFLVVFPEDIHRTLGMVDQPEAIRKAIVKIAIDCL